MIQSYENPFSDSVDNDLPIDIESDEQFIGTIFKNILFAHKFELYSFI